MTPCQIFRGAVKCLLLSMSFTLQQFLELLQFFAVWPVSVGCRFPLREIRVLCAAEGCRWGSNYYCYIIIKSWTLSGNPQRYTEPPWPSAELCTVPFLSLASSSISRTWVGGHQTLFRFIINIALCRTSCPLRTVHSIQLNSNWTYMYRVTNKYQGTTTF